MPEIMNSAHDNGMTPFFEKEFTVQYYETDQRGFARPVALLNYLQAVGGDHAALLGVSVTDLHKSGHTWVLSRIHIAMERYPRGGSIVRIKTWPVSRENLFTVRDFELFDGAGALIGRATTSWAVLNLKTRRPVKLDDVLPIYPLHPGRALPDTFSTLPELEQPEYELRLPVLRGDLDLNRHVNNTVYVGWALETVPDEVDKSSCPSSIEIGFRAEALYGETVVIRTAKAEEPHCYIHNIESAGDGRELTRLRTCWAPMTRTFN